MDKNKAEDKNMDKKVTIDIDVEGQESKQESHKGHLEKDFFPELTKKRKVSKFNIFKKSPRKKKISGFVPDNTHPFVFCMSSSDGDDGRAVFIQKTFFMLLIMLLATAGILYFIYTTEAISDAFSGPFGLLIFLLGGFLSLLAPLSMACCACARAPPMNFIMAIIIVIGMSLMSGHAICKYRLEVIAHAFLATCVVVLICLLLSFTPIDFTKYLIYVAVILSALFVCTMGVYAYQMITGIRMKAVFIGILFAEVLFLSIGFIIELQSVLGGKEVQLEEDEWVVGAVALYTSIILMFLKLLEALGLLEEDNSY